MINPISVDIRTILLDNLVTDVPIAVGTEPPEPSDVVTIYDTGGGEQNAKYSLDESSIQIRSRSIKYLDGFKISNKIKKILEGMKPITVGSSDYIGLWAATNISFLKRDDANRVIWVCNYRVIRGYTTVDDAGNRIIL